jgi:hypothetical protein
VVISLGKEASSPSIRERVMSTNCRDSKAAKENSVNQSINQSHTQSINQALNQALNQSINQALNQPIS